MASQSDTKTSRANIKIEIKNDFSEEMDVDMSGESNPLSEEIEDGEISDCKDVEEAQTINKVTFKRTLATNRAEVQNQWPSSDGGFSTGVDIFAKDEQVKLQTRAQRFGLDPLDCTSMSDQQLQELHDSLGITTEDELTTRFEAIHMYGTTNMSTQDVFGYFGRFGPASIEWINDESCNVVWLDKISAARAFHGTSSAIGGMPITGNCDPFKDELDDVEREKGRSILLMSKDREIELYDETPMEDEHVITHVSQINAAIPPGFWRIGSPHPKAKYIMLRYAKRTDKKPFRAERFSEYYKKFGNPNFGGMIGLISESKKKRMKGLPDVVSEPPAVEVVKGNPWGNLAKNWNNSVNELVSDAPATVKPTKSILERLGIATKRSQSVSEDEDETVKAKKSKVPRMRMYADEEEARVLKVKQLKKLRALENIEKIIMKNTSQSIPDLRNRISRQPVAKPPIIELQSIDTNVRLRPELERKKLVAVRQIVSDNSEEDDDDDLNVQQRSKVTLIVKKPVKPTVASTIWSRLDREKKAKESEVIVEKDSDSSSNNDTSENSDSDTDEYDSAVRSKFSKAVNHRPGFNRDLKSRLGLTTDHKSPLRIEINNDHYSKS